MSEQPMGQKPSQEASNPTPDVPIPFALITSDSEKESGDDSDDGPLLRDDTHGISCSLFDEDDKGGLRNVGITGNDNKSTQAMKVMKKDVRVLTSHLRAMEESKEPSRPYGKEKDEKSKKKKKKIPTKTGIWLSSNIHKLVTKKIKRAYFAKQLVDS